MLNTLNKKYLERRADRLARLRRLGLIYKIGENKRIFVGEDDYRGQGSLF